MALPDSLAWIKNEIFFEDLSAVGNANLTNDWYLTFYEEEKLNEQYLLEDFRKCEIWEEFIRGFYLDFYEGIKSIEYLININADIMEEAEWWDYHKLMIREFGAEDGLKNLPGFSFVVCNVQVNVLDAWFGTETRGKFWENYYIFTIVCELDGEKTSFIGELNDLNFCPFRRKSGDCIWCGGYDDGVFYPHPDTFSEWLRLSVESKLSD